MRKPILAAVMIISAIFITEGMAMTDSIDIGDRKQLFIDSRFIMSSRNVGLVMNSPRKIGAVIRCDQPWELGHIGLGWGVSVVETDGVYKMWYQSYSQEKNKPFYCYATSRDGVHWEKPDVGVIEYAGSKSNNIVMQGVNATTVFLDAHGTPDAKYKAVSMGIFIQTSPDGIHWTMSRTPVFPFCCDTANQAMWDTRLSKYVAYIRLWDWAESPEESYLLTRRKIGRVETDDITKPWPFTPVERPFHLWGKKQPPAASLEVPVAFSYDAQDPQNMDHYNPAAVQYAWAENVYLMFPSAYLHFPLPPAGPCLYTAYSDSQFNDGFLDIQMAVSRDGVTYKRLESRPYLGLSPEGTKDSKALYMGVGMLRAGDELMQYYGGYNTTHGKPYGRDNGAIFCAVQRLDGFVSADFAYSGGELVTPRITFKGSRLILNIDTSALGEMAVGMLDETGKEIPGFTAVECEPLHGNDVRYQVKWKNKPDISKLTGKTVQLRFIGRSAKLYAFQFEN